MATELEFHPIANIFPLMQGEKFDKFVEDIEERGLQEAIWIYEDKILDGRNRWLALQALGLELEEGQYREWTPRFEGDTPLAFVLSLNNERRHLTKSQLAMVAVEILPIHEAEAEERMLAGVALDPEQIVAQGSRAPQARDIAAKAVGVNRQYVSDAKAIKEADPELAEEVFVGTKSLAQAKREMMKLYRQDGSDTETPVTTKTYDVALYNDDALQLIPLLDDGSIALVITDPPYNTTNHEWDQFGKRDDFMVWMGDWLESLQPKMADDYHLFVFCDPDYMVSMEALLGAKGWPIKSRIIWEYRNLVKGRDVTDKFIENYQVCFHCGNHPLNWYEKWDDRRFMVQRHAVPQSNYKEGKYHPTAKPLKLFKLLVDLGSKPGDVVLDCFAGGGTTGEACKEVGARKCLLIEQDESFCQVIERRLGIQREV